MNEVTSVRLQSPDSINLTTYFFIKEEGGFENLYECDKDGTDPTLIGRMQKAGHLHYVTTVDGDISGKWFEQDKAVYFALLAQYKKKGNEFPTPQEKLVTSVLSAYRDFYCELSEAYGTFPNEVTTHSIKVDAKLEVIEELIEALK